MADHLNVRKERIEKLLHELRYEITRGMLEREIEEEITFRFVVPLSQHIRDGVVLCEFKASPASRHMAAAVDPTPKLHIVK